jgi:hypothetical protein
MATTAAVKTVVCLIIVTALRDSYSYRARTIYDCERVDNFGSLNAVKPAGKRLTTGPLGVYAMISSTKCYVQSLNQPVLEQHCPAFFQDNKNALVHMHISTAGGVGSENEFGCLKDLLASGEYCYTRGEPCEPSCECSNQKRSLRAA